MKKDVAHYLMLIFRQIILIILVLVSLFAFWHIIFGKMESWEATIHTIFYTILSFLYIPICNKLIKINQESTNKTKKFFLVIISFLLALFMLIYNLVSFLGICNCIKW